MISAFLGADSLDGNAFSRKEYTHARTHTLIIKIRRGSHATEREGRGGGEDGILDSSR
jgi:hypothetical protein